MDFNFSPSQSIEYKKILLTKVIAEIQNRLKEYKIKDFKPLPHQKAFIKSNAKTTMLLGGNRSGKTTAGISNLILYVLDLHPVHRLTKNAMVWVVGLDTPNHINPILIPRVMEFIPSFMVDSFDKVERRLTLKNGCTIYFKSCDSGVGKFQSAAVDFLWFDEEPPENIWRESYTRTIDKAAPIYITMTPTNGVSWSYHELYTKHDGKLVNVITAKLTDNTYLPQNEVQAFLDRLDESEKLVRLEGRYVQFGSKRIFSREIVDKLEKTIIQPIGFGEIYNGKLIADTNQNSGLKIYKEPNPEDIYVLGVDTSEGVDDNTAMVLLGYNKDNKTIYTSLTFNKVIQPEQIHQTVLAISRYANNPLVIIERNSTGAAIIDRLKQYGINLYIEEKPTLYGTKIGTKLGWHTDGISKAKMIRDTKELLMNTKIKLFSSDILHEIDDYIEDNKGRAKGATGHDDLLMAFMLALQAMLSSQFSEEVFAYEKVELARAAYADVVRPRYADWVKY